MRLLKDHSAGEFWSASVAGVSARAALASYSSTSASSLAANLASAAPAARRLKNVARSYKCLLPVCLINLHFALPTVALPALYVTVVRLFGAF